MDTNQIRCEAVYVAQKGRDFLIVRVDTIMDSGTILGTDLTTQRGINLQADQILYEPLKPTTIAHNLARGERTRRHPAGV